MAQLLTPENFRQGFLVDEELMAGITEDPEQKGVFVAFILRHTTGEYLGYQSFPTLQPALETLNQIPRTWTFERIGGGCGGACGTGGCSGKGGGNCKVKQASGQCGGSC